MATKHRGKAAQAAWAAKQGEKIQRARANYDPDAATREAERDHEYVLDQAAARRPLGRPVTAPAPRKPRQVMLSDAEADTARRLGDGNLSEGVRKALSDQAKISY